MANQRAAEVGNQFDKVKDRYIWVDVRTQEEYQQGHIPGSIHIPHDEIELRANEELEAYRKQSILLICRSGKRSQIAEEILRQLGFDSLYQLEGGMERWTGPIEKG